MTLGDRLKSARGATLLRRGEVAERAGISEEELADFENDTQTPDETTRAKLAEVLQIQPGDLDVLA